MTHMESGSEILKTDDRGRVRTAPERRRQLLEEFDRSGLSAPKFAAVTGLKYQTLAGWLHRRKREQAGKVPVAAGPPTQPVVQWFETVVEQAQGSRAAVSSPLIIRLPSGAALEVANAAQASLAGTVLRGWERAAC